MAAGEVEAGNDRKMRLTISTLNGDFTDDFPEHMRLQKVVDKAIEKLKLVGNGPWVLELDGKELDLNQTIEHAEKEGLDEGDVLTLNTEEGGGGSDRE